MAISFKNFLECVPHVIKAGIQTPIMLRSRHGVGKSCLVYQIAKDILNLPVVERRASQMTEGDLLGLPSLENKTTTWNLPDWYMSCVVEPKVLFIDELDRASTEVRQGFFELADSRKLAGIKLHEGTIIFAAINGGGDRSSQYQVGELDPAELDRWTVYDVEPSIEDWIVWAKVKGLNKYVINFIKENPSHLEHTKDYEPGKVYPSRRSWERLSNVLCSCGLCKGGEFSEVVFNIVDSFVGSEASFKFTDYVRAQKEKVLPEDIIDKGNFKLVKDFDVNDHSNLIDLMEDFFKKDLTQNQCDNLSTYSQSVPSELSYVILRKIIQLNSNNLPSWYEAHNGAMHKLISDHLAIVKTEKGKEVDKNEQFSK